MGHVDVDDLPISQELKNRINAWDDVYQATFRDDYPPDSGFDTISAKTQHEADGDQLARMINCELNGGYIVKYLR